MTATKKTDGFKTLTGSDPKGRLVTLKKQGKKFMVTKDQTSVNIQFSENQRKKAEEEFQFQIADSQNIN